jgi:hypothetical protein
LKPPPPEVAARIDDIANDLAKALERARKIYL